MLETLEARLAAQSEAFFPELRPAITSGPRSLKPRLPSTTKPPASLSRTGASKPPISTEPKNPPSGINTAKKQTPRTKPQSLQKQLALEEAKSSREEGDHMPIFLW